MLDSFLTWPSPSSAEATAEIGSCCSGKERDSQLADMMIVSVPDARGGEMTA